ncbi:MAG: hypothetical protein AAGA48_11045 [Myxococcota bacterium]
MARKGRMATGAMMGTGPVRRGGRRKVEHRLGDVARQRIQEAHAHLAAGEAEPAATKFQRMANVAQEREMPRVAAHLGAHAALAHAMAGDREAFTASLDAAVAEAQKDGDKDRTSRLFGRFLDRLADTPFADDAATLKPTLRNQLGVTPKAPAADPSVNRSMRRHLPKRCANCGADVDEATIAFNDDGSVDCDRCGSLLTG